MSEERKVEIINLSYQSIQKKIKVPLYFSSIEYEFLNLFKEDKNKKFCYYYLDDENDKLEITNSMTDTDFQNSINELIQKDNPTIFIEIQKNEEKEKEDKNEEKNEKEVISKKIPPENEVEDNGNNTIVGSIVVSQIIKNNEENSEGNINEAESISNKEEKNLNSGMVFSKKKKEENKEKEETIINKSPISSKIISSKKCCQ